jgi:uncharacterized membrane protein
MKEEHGRIIAAALVGIVAAAGAAQAKDKKKTKDADTIKCYGVNKCAGHNKCGSADNACAGKNACKGKGWLPMPKESCENIEGGVIKEPAAKKTGMESMDKKKPMKDAGGK